MVDAKDNNGVTSLELKNADTILLYTRFAPSTDKKEEEANGQLLLVEPSLAFKYYFLALHCRIATYLNEINGLSYTDIRSFGPFSTAENIYPREASLEEQEYFDSLYIDDRDFYERVACYLTSESMRAGLAKFSLGFPIENIGKEFVQDVHVRLGTLTLAITLSLIPTPQP